MLALGVPPRAQLAQWAHQTESDSQTRSPFVASRMFIASLPTAAVSVERALRRLAQRRWAPRAAPTRGGWR